MKQALTLLVVAACAVAQKEVTKFPRSADAPELERLLPEMQAGFPAERGKALKMALVRSHAHPYVEAGKTHRRIAVWVGLERSGATGPTCFVEMHDYDQTKTDDGWTPPKWVGHSPREQEGDHDAAIICSELQSNHRTATPGT
jgi:hypothetical protein